MDAPHHRSVKSVVFDTHRVRCMLGLVMSLSLVLSLVHLPLHSPTDRVGWSARSGDNRILLADVTTEPQETDPSRSERTPSSGGETAPPPTDLRSFQSDSSPDLASSEQADAGSDSTQGNSGLAEKYDDVRSVTELGVKDRHPKIVGGMGNLYLHINYPQEARNRGIEGTLKLEFTVKPDGGVSNIKVIESLHPLCDSAAVRGIRSVRFVPAKRNGQPIPIRLRLPVEFRLRTLSSSAVPNDEGP